MSSISFANLVKAKKLKSEPFDHAEFMGLINSAKARLKDANNKLLAPESRFDLGYNAAHAIALAALRWHGYRPDSRYIVFQLLAQTVEVGPDIWRVLAKCHDCRNLAEYEGFLEIDEHLLNELLTCTQTLLNQLKVKGML